MEIATSSSIRVNAALQRFRDLVPVLDDCPTTPVSSDGRKLEWEPDSPVRLEKNPLVPLLGEDMGEFRAALLKQDVWSAFRRADTDGDNRGACARFGYTFRVIVPELTRPRTTPFLLGQLSMAIAEPPLAGRNGSRGRSSGNGVFHYQGHGVFPCQGILEPLIGENRRRVERGKAMAAIDLRRPSFFCAQQGGK